MVEETILQGGRLPRHIAIIMDGNGRWAKERKQERVFGHAEGVVSVRKVLEAATKIGLEYLTVYTFSTENWERPEEEIVALMELLVSAIERETPDLMKNNIRLQIIGDLDRLPLSAREALDNCIQTTAGNTGTTLILALSYSARWEIVRAARRLVKEVEGGCLTVDGITETVFAERLTTVGIPDPDMLIRTGGEKRISNFLLWQASYAELYFTDVFWPDFREEQLYEAIRDYQQRERRFGKTSEQIR
ncbi:MAG: isoprenyl transferase [Tannerellaceae bacterium]|jgi:undecaprenyl diphosphate synthase|nr:isoprenyl transferase [Tannerellaceae bacterium]